MRKSSKIKLIRLQSDKKYQRLLGKDLANSIKCGHVILKKGENIGKHTTGGREEVIIILKGRGKAAIDRVSRRIEAGRVLYIPPQTKHDIKNTGSRALEYIYVTSIAVR